MADSMESGSWGGSWWGSWVQAAKEKSATAMEFMKKDLAEFTNTVQRDTSSAVQVTGSTLKDTFKSENTEAAKDKMKQSVNGFFEGLSKALTIPAEDKDQNRTRTKDLGAGGAIYDRSKARLHAIQVDPGTYLNEPSGSPELFRRWLETFNLDKMKGDISELLVVKVEVRALYTKLVPSEMSHSEFWQRYFYKIHQLQQDEARKQALMKRVETPTEHYSLGWEDDWSGDECEEFEKVTESEVKAVQREDVQTRLSPVPDNKDVPSNNSYKKHISATEENKSVNSEDVTGMSKSEKETIHATSSSVPAVDSGIQKVDKCDSPESKEKICDANESNSEAHATEELAPVSEAATPESNIPTPAPEQTQTNKTSESHPDEQQTPKAAVTVTKEEADASVAQSTTEHPEITQAELIPECRGESESQNTQSIDVKESSSSDLVAEAVTKELKTKEKGDLVVVGSDRESPTSDSSGNKEPSVDDDWEHDFDVELTEEELKAAEEIAKKMGSNLDSQDDDWEDWE